MLIVAFFVCIVVAGDESRRARVCDEKHNAIVLTRYEVTSRALFFINIGGFVFWADLLSGCARRLVVAYPQVLNFSDSIAVIAVINSRLVTGTNEARATECLPVDFS